MSDGLRPIFSHLAAAQEAKGSLDGLTFWRSLPGFTTALLLAGLPELVEYTPLVTNWIETWLDETYGTRVNDLDPVVADLARQYMRKVHNTEFTQQFLQAVGFSRLRVLLKQRVVRVVSCAGTGI